MNRTLAAVLALIALILAIVGAGLVLTAEDDGPGGVTVIEPTGGQKPLREHARVDKRRKVAPEPEDLVLDDSPLPQPERLPAATGSGFVRGTVVDLASGDVLPETNVRLLHPTGEQIALTVTDHSGRYVLEHVPEEIPLLVEFTRPGFLTGHCCDLQLQPEEITRKDVRLMRAPFVSVRVRAMPWQRAAGEVRVRIHDGPREIASGTTDEMGRVRLPVPEFGQFQLSVGGLQWAQSPSIAVDLMPGSGDLERDADVYRGGHVAVKVKDRTGSHMGDVRITVHGQGLEPVSGTTTAEGSVQLGPFPPGVPLRVIATGADGEKKGATIVQARDGHDEDVTLTLVRAATVRGEVKDDRGRPVRRVRVDVRLADGGPLLGTVTTDARGQFEFAGAPHAALEIVTQAPAFAAMSPIRLDRATDRATLQLDRRPSGRLRGYVEHRSGEPVAGAEVRLAPSDLVALTDQRGWYEFDFVPADEVQRLLVTAEGLRVVAAVGGGLQVTLREREKARLDVEMESTGTANVPATLEEAAEIRTVRGTVVRRSGSPVASARVWWAGLEVVTESDGRFELRLERRGATVARPLLVITPPAGLLEPLLLPLRSPTSEGVVDVEEIGLRDRHSCRIALTAAPDSGGRSLAFALLMDGTDRLMDRNQAPFQSRTNVTYDGHWLHVAPIGDWRVGGQRRAYVGITSPTGPLAAWADWPVSAGASLGVTPEWRDAVTRAVMKIPKEFVGGTATFHLRAAPEGMPILSMGLQKTFETEISKRKFVIQPLLRGEWDVIAHPAGGDRRVRLDVKVVDGKQGRAKVSR